VRKAYIVQFAPDGALAWRDGRETPAPQRDAEHQFEILCGGEAAEAGD
jgi:hypothetical protein